MPIASYNDPIFKGMIREYYNHFTFNITKLALNDKILFPTELLQEVWDTILVLIEEGKIVGFQDINKNTANLLCQEILLTKEGVDWIIMMAYIGLALQETYTSLAFRAYYKEALTKFRNSSDLP